jgi:hypothetical protein
MNLGTTRLRGRPRNRWQDEVRDDGRTVGGEGWQEKVHNRGMEEASENGKESSNSAHANGMYEWIKLIWITFNTYTGADKSLARPTSQCILFDGENISFDSSLVIYI